MGDVAVTTLGNTPSHNGTSTLSSVFPESSTVSGSKYVLTDPEAE